MARFRARRVLHAAAAALVLGCASQGARSGAVQRNVVSAEELAVAGDVNVYEALSRVRPAFLRGRQAVGVDAQAVTVYLDGVQMVEGLDYLRTVGAKSVGEVRFLEPQQANARFGGNNSGGALLISTKK